MRHCVNHMTTATSPDRPIGSGPHPEPWPVGDNYDKELLKRGDRRNVIDKYRYWTVDAIKADLDKSRSTLHIAIENLERDFNIGTIVRNANAFNVAAVHIIGKKQWNRRGAMVTDAYMNIFYHSSVDNFVDAMKTQELEVISFDITKKAKSLSDVNLPRKAVFVFGAEGPGISEELLKKSDQVVMIEQHGSTRSVNVGVASGIAMYQWNRIINKSHPEAVSAYF